MNNFKYDVNSLITLKELVVKYDEDKENMLLEDFKLGRIVMEVFLDVKRVQKRVKGRPTWHYNLVEIPISCDLDAGSSAVVCVIKLNGWTFQTRSLNSAGS